MKLLGTGQSTDPGTSFRTHDMDSQSALAKKCMAECPEGTLALTNTLQDESCICYPSDNAQSLLIPFVMTNMKPLGIGIGGFS